MIIYPAIDLRGGRVVRLTEGKFDQEKSYGDDPLAVAREFKAAGATWLHVVDLDGAIRDEAQVAALLSAGVRRVIVGSLAVRSPDLVRGWIKSFGPEHIILSPDVRLDATGVPRIAAAGWQETTGVALDDFLHDYLAAGLVHILCTD